MKKRLFLIASLLIAVNVLFAQDCSSYYYFQKNTEVEMSMLNPQGNTVMKNIYKVSSVRKEGASSISDFSITTLNEKGDIMSSGKGQAKCTGGELMMDMKKFVPDMFPIKDMKVESDGNSLLSYPAGMKEGQKLSDGSLQMSGSAEGMEMSLQCQVTDRKVVAREKITTAGGSWNCLKITCKVNLTVKMMSMNVPVQMDMTEWFAPGFGVVKINTDKDGRSAGVMEVTKVSK